MRNKILAFALMALVFLTGCWDRRELNTLAIVAGTAVDLAGKNRVAVTYQIINPAGMKRTAESTGMGGSTETNGITVDSSTGNTIFDAIRNYYTEGTRYLYFPHNQLLVIGEEVARRGVCPLIDVFIRDPSIRPGMWILVAKGKGGDILRVKAGFQNIPAFGIADLVDRSESGSFVSKVDLQQFSNQLAGGATAPVAPLAEVTEKSDSGGKKTKRARLIGSAVFRHDQMAGQLSPHETRGLLWVQGQVKSGVIAINVPGGTASLEITHARARMVSELRDGQPRIRVNIEVEANLGELRTTAAGEQVNPQLLKTFGNRGAAVIRNEVTSAFRKSQQFDADIFGFGEEFHHHFRHQWPGLRKNWDRSYRRLDLEVEATVNVRMVGVTGKPICQIKEGNE